MIELPDLPIGLRLKPVRSAGLIFVLSTVVFLASAFAGSSSALASEAPIAAYSFDEGEGEVAEDSAGEHDGALEHTEWVKGKYGSAIYLDGNSDFVSIADSPDLRLTEEFTIEAWVRPDSAQTDAPVIEKETSNFYSYKLLAGGETAGVPEGFVADAPFSWEEVADEEALTNKAWSHLAMTYDGAAIRLYVNGKLVDTNSAPGPQGSEGNLIIGGEETEDFFKGRIDEIRIYDRALDGGEVTADKAAPIQTPRTGPIAAYSFDEGEGEVAEDSAGEHDGTIEGAEWARGKYGSALKFNAEDGDVVKVPVSEDFEVEEFTLQAWVRPEEDLEYAPVVANTSSGFGYSLYAGGDGGYLGHPEARITEDRWGETVSTVADPPALPLNAWSHLTATYDGAFLQLYINGELVDTDDAPSVIAGEGELQIGGDEDWSAAGFFDGRIDEVRIYDRALDAQEVEPDVTPPTPPTDLSAVFDPEESETEVSWNPSIDPASPNGHPGSGIRDYSFRYRLEGGAWTPWQSTAGTSFGISETEEEEKIRVAVLATDVTGNSSPLRAATLIATPTTVTPEDVGDEEINEQGDSGLAPEPAYFDEIFNNEFSARDSFEEKLCGSGSNPCGKYNGRAAAAYAVTWDLKGMGQDDARRNSNRNFDYFGGEGGDCTNFVSQALYNGGMRFMRANGVNDPDGRDPEVRQEFEHGNSSWWSYYFLINNGPFSARDYEVTESWVRAYVLREQLLNNNLAKVVLPGERLKVGDIVFYNLVGLNLSEADHSQMVVRVGNHRAWVAQHSPGYIQTLRRVLNRNDYEGHELHTDWTFQVVRPYYTAANIEG